MAEKADSEKLALRTAEKLLGEIKPRPGTELRHTLLTNMAAVSTKNKHTVEQALASFMEICSNEVKVTRSRLKCQGHKVKVSILCCKVRWSGS